MTGSQGNPLAESLLERVHGDAAASPAPGKIRAGAGGFLPALFAGYRDLSRLRFDYPLILAQTADGVPVLEPLSSVVDGILEEIAPEGAKGQRMRRHLLTLEQEIRTRVFGGSSGLLSELWSAAQAGLVSGAGPAMREDLEHSLARARAALRMDGRILGCDGDTAGTVLLYVWRGMERERAACALERIDRLVSGLSDLLRVDRMRSGDWWTAERLHDSIGSSFRAAFDFQAMARLLGGALRPDTMPEVRRRRIEEVLAILKSQRFFALPEGPGAGANREEAHSFVFDSCTRALEAFQARLADMSALVRALAIARLELDNAYSEAGHDDMFAHFGPDSLTPADLAVFPSYLIRIREQDLDGIEQASLFDGLVSGLHFKVLVQCDDLLESPPIHAGGISFGRYSLQLASMAVGCGGVHVLQSTSSSLYRAREQIRRGLRYDGPTLFSIFSGAGTALPGVPPYLVAAAAMESRAFPTFSYDPSAASGRAARFNAGDNPQPHLDWPGHRVEYEDKDLQRCVEDVAFTFVDFAGGDRRRAGCLTEIPRPEWSERQIPVSEYLELDAAGRAGIVPYILMIDELDKLHRFAVGEPLIAAAEHCLARWRDLQELGGLNRSQPGEGGDVGAPAGKPEGHDGKAVQTVVAPASRETIKPSETAVAGQPPQAASTDEPYIETARCTTCNECTGINDRMFAYNENRQAYIADPDAGTYRELVEAAEKCQVCIIHPGRPRNPAEPNLSEWIERARPFASAQT